MVQEQDFVDPPVNPNFETSRARHEEDQVLSVVVVFVEETKDGIYGNAG